MKSSILLLFIALSTYTLSQVPNPSWRTIETGTKDYILKIAFTDSLHGWIMNASNDFRYSILHTEDGGETWQKQNLPIDTLSLSDWYFTDKNTGYIVGSNGLILATKDGGNIWIK